MKENLDVIEKLIAAHVNETQWINDHKEEDTREINIQLKKLTGKELPEDLLSESTTRLEFTYDPNKQSLFKSANDAYDLGFLAKGEARPNLSGIYDLVLLDQALTEKGFPTIEDAVTTTGGSELGGSKTTTSAPLSDVVSSQIENPYFLLVLTIRMLSLKASPLLRYFLPTEQCDWPTIILACYLTLL